MNPEKKSGIENNETIPNTPETPTIINTPDAQTPVNTAEVNVVKTAEEIAEEKKDAESEVQIATIDIQTEMTLKDLKENLTEENLNKIMSNPEKAKLFFGNAITVFEIAKKFAGSLSDKAFEVIAPTLKEAIDWYAANELKIKQIRDGVILVGAMGAAAFGASEALQYDTEAVNPEQKMIILKGFLIQFAGTGLAIYKTAQLFWRKDKIKRAEIKAAKMNQQATA